jgi:glycogen debranching enzyme
METLSRLVVCTALAFLFGSLGVGAQTRPVAPESDLTLSTDSTEPVRFMAVHGRRAAIFGYPKNGLEMWAWPFQILNGYRIGIRPRDSTSEIDGNLLLRRIEYSPDAVTRIYIGPDFVVHERLFVPLDQPGAIITYKVEGRGQVDILLHFTPVLDLMWPAGIGGQSTAWNEALSGYVISDAAAGYTATIASRDVVNHDSTENSAIRYGDGLAFTIRPNASAQIFIALNRVGGRGALVDELIAGAPALEQQAAGHYADLVHNGLQIETPDQDVNRAITWSEIALDQAWVCNPDLGCGLVAGYGPSRTGRRPQYAWFFAGDGLVATDSLVSTGEYDRARAELEFILKYQDQNTGMIWHEISQSAGYIDWAGKYPYMFVHVDITFQFLGVVARYVEASGDIDFAREHWSAIEAAFRYCQSLVDPATRLPRIPPDKEGNNEQDRESDELSLSAEWLDAATAFAALAKWTNHSQEQGQADRAIQSARQAIAVRYWDNARQFWISGHTMSGSAIFDQSSGPSELIAKHVFTPEQDEALLDKIASSGFQTDWGSRGLSSSSNAFDPGSYATGSVFALNTTEIAETFWSEHRPTSAFAMWSSILPWIWLDSPGHIHEVLAGDYYHQQTESVPEQTWSSAGFLSTTARGLLGLRINSMSNQIAFSPHLPPEWHDVAVHNVRMQHAELDLQLERSEENIELTVTNRGNPTSFVFDPQVPLGARLLGSECANRRLIAFLERNAHDEHIRLAFTAAQGTIRCDIRFQGGVEVMAPHLAPLLGNPSTGIKITSVDLRDSSLIVEADVNDRRAASFEIETPWKSSSVDGGVIRQIAGDLYRFELDRGSMTPDSFGYSHHRAVIHFEGTLPTGPPHRRTAAHS